MLGKSNSSRDACIPSSLNDRQTSQRITWLTDSSLNVLTFVCVPLFLKVVFIRAPLWIFINPPRLNSSPSSAAVVLQTSALVFESVCRTSKEAFVKLSMQNSFSESLLLCFRIISSSTKQGNICTYLRIISTVQSDSLIAVSQMTELIIVNTQNSSCSAKVSPPKEE